jgi:hypothetical protein
MLAPLVVLEVALMSADWNPVLVGLGAVLSAFALIVVPLFQLWSHSILVRKVDTVIHATNGINSVLQAKVDEGQAQLAARDRADKQEPQAPRV